MKPYHYCRCCGAELSHKKYTYCNSCSKVDGRSNLQYSEDMASKDNRFYPLYRSVMHFKNITPTLDVREFIKHLLEAHTQEELLGSMLFRLDVDIPFGMDNYRLSRKRDYRGNANKMKKKGQSDYIGVHFKTMKNGNKIWSSSLNGKYVTGICGMDEVGTAMARDEHIISLGLEDDYRLNFGLN